MEVPRLQLFLRPERWKSAFYLSMMNYRVLWGRESEGWRHGLQSHFSHLSWSTHITKEFTWQTCINILWKIHISAHTSGEKPEKVWFYIYNYLAKLQRSDKPTVCISPQSSISNYFVFTKGSSKHHRINVKRRMWLLFSCSVVSNSLLPYGLQGVGNMICMGLYCNKQGFFEK